MLPLCLTLCNPIDYSLPGLSVHGILQARILGYKNVFKCPLVPPGKPLLFVYMYTKVFLLPLIRVWKRTSKKRRDGETGKRKLHETGAPASLQLPRLRPLLSGPVQGDKLKGFYPFYTWHCADTEDPWWTRSWISDLGSPAPPYSLGWDPPGLVS